MTLYLQPFGRIGNNVIQLFRALYYCKTNNINLNLHDFKDELKDHASKVKYNLLQYIESFFEFSKNDSLERFKSNLWFNSKELPNCTPFKESQELIDKFVKYYIDYSLTESNEFVIQIRSGDVIYKFDDVILEHYRQPPIDYYRNIIKKENPNIIIIVGEHDAFNPVIDILLKEYKNAVYIKGTAEQDFIRSCNANVLVCANSTFSTACNILTNKNKRIYRPKEKVISTNDFNKYHRDVEMICYYDEEYFNSEHPKTLQERIHQLSTFKYKPIE